MKFDYILINGDSYSAPADFPVWGDNIANDLNIPLINLSIAGSNNKRILRSTIEHLESDEMLGRNPLVIIAWSFVRRLEVWHHKESKLITLDWILGTPDATDYHKNLILDDPKKIHKIIVDFYTDLFLLATYLESKKINYFFFSGANNEECNPYWFKPATDLHLCYHVLNNENIKSIHDFSLAMWAKNNDPDCEATWHLSPTGHQEFSKVIKGFLPS